MSRINPIGKVEQAAGGGLLDEMVEDAGNDALEVSEEAMDRVSRRRSIEATAELDNRVLEFSCDRSSAVDVLVVELKILKLRHYRGRRDIQKVVYRSYVSHDLGFAGHDSHALQPRM